MSLIEQARANVALRRQDERLQSSADEICTEMRLSCERLLNERGERIKYGDDGRQAGPFGRALARLFIATLLSGESKQFGVSMFEGVDHCRLRTTIDSDEDSPIKVTLVSTLAVPAKSVHIGVNVEGLDERLSLEPDHGVIYKIHKRMYNKDLLYGLAPTEDYAWEVDRRANLEDAHHWQEEIIDKLVLLS